MTNPTSRSSDAPSTSALEPDSPFPGLASYSEAQAEYFHGREAEARALYRSIFHAQLTVLFSKSGIGKTSLLRAGLFPQLRRNRFLPIYIELPFVGEGTDLLELVAHRIRSLVDRRELSAEPLTRSETLWEYFHRVRFWAPTHDLLVPVLVFDQFERLLTEEHPTEAAADFLVQLADLVENRLPEVVAQRLEASGSRAFHRAGKPNYRVLVAIREDFLPQFEHLAQNMPSLHRNRIRLVRMRGDRARDAILAASAQGGLLSDAVAEQIVRLVADSGSADDGSHAALERLAVEPALLSLVCSELNERRRQQRPASRTISEKLVRSARGEIIPAFYERCMESMPEAVRHFVEDELVDSAGFRTVASLDRALQRGAPAVAIERLIDQKLLRREQRIDRPHLELIHDRLAPVVLESRQEREAVELAQKRRQIRQDIRRRRIWTGLAATVILAAAATVLWTIARVNVAIEERNAALREQNAAESDRDAAISNRDAAVSERNTAIADRAAAQQELEDVRDGLTDARALAAQALEQVDQVRGERDQLSGERDSVLADKERVERQLVGLNDQLGEMESDRDVAQELRDMALDQAQAASQAQAESEQRLLQSLLENLMYKAQELVSRDQRPADSVRLALQAIWLGERMELGGTTQNPDTASARDTQGNEQQNQTLFGTLHEALWSLAQDDGWQPTRQAGALWIAPDGRTARVAAAGARVVEWDPTHLHGTALNEYRARSHRLGEATLAVAFAPDGQSVATGGLSGEVSVTAVNGEAANWPRPLRVATEVTALSFAPDGRQLAIGQLGARPGEAPGVVLWEPGASPAVRRLGVATHGADRQARSAIRVVGFDDDHNLYAGWSGGLIRWTAGAAPGAQPEVVWPTAEYDCEVQREGCNVTAFAVGADGRAVLGLESGELVSGRVGDHDGWQMLSAAGGGARPHRAQIEALTLLDPKGDFAATGLDGQISFWAPTSGQPAAGYRRTGRAITPDGWIRAIVAVSPSADNTRVYTAAANGVVRRWTPVLATLAADACRSLEARGIAPDGGLEEYFTGSVRPVNQCETTP